MAVTAKFSADFSSFLDAVKKADSSLNLWQANISKVEGSMKRLDNAFSGRSIIQEATQVASAIEKIGGASKLTEAEQRRVNATVTEAIAKYKALGMEAPKAMTDLAKATQQANTEMSLVSKGADFLKSTFAQFTAANLAATAISKVTAEVGRFIEQGAKLQGVETSFQRLSNGAKQNSEVMLGAMQEGTRGLVSNLELMTQANKAMLLGLPVTTQSMGELAKTATILGKAMGQDATQSLNDLITALGRSSPMILDNLGLTVKVGEANEAYAKKLGKTAEELTESEKKMAFYEAAMEAARRKTAELGEQTLTLGERMSQVWTKVENVVTRRVSDMNLVLGKATESWTEFFKFIGDSARFKSWDELAKRLRPEAKIGLPFADPSALARQSQAYQDELEQAKKDYDKLKADQKKAEEEATRNLKENARDRAEATRQSYEETRQALKAYYDMVMKANMGITHGIEDLNLRKSTEVNILSGLTGQWFKYLDAIQTVNNQIKLGLDSAPGQKFTPEMLLGGEGGQWIESLKKSGQKAGLAFGRELSQAIIGAIQGGGNVGQAIGATIGGQVGSKLGGTLASSIGGMFGQTLGGMLGPLGAIGGQLLGGLVDKIFGKSKERKAVEDGVKQMFGTFDNLQKKLASTFDPAVADKFWRAITQGGKKGPEALDALTKALQLQEEILRRTTPTYDNVTEAAERYGLTVEGIGEAVDSLRVMEVGQQAADDWRLMAKAGADMEAVARGMADEIQELVDESLEWGHALPESMKPIIQKMKDMGLLTDLTGEKLDDLDEIKWAKPLEDSIDGLIAKLDELIDRLGNGVGGAIARIPKNVDVSVNSHYNNSGGGGSDVPGFAGGTNGFRNFGRGTLAMLHGVEAVIRPGDAVPGGGEHVTNVYLDGDVLVRHVERGLDRKYRSRQPVGAAA